MRSPTDIIWEVIGDVFLRTFEDDYRRQIEAIWQAMFDTSADAYEYAEYYKKARNVFEVEPYAPWGTFGSEITFTTTDSDLVGILFGVNNQTAIIYSENEFSPSGFLRFFQTAIEYEGVTTDVLLSGGYVGRLTGTNVPSSPTWDEIDTPSYFFTSSTTLDGTQRWDFRGSGGATPTDTGLFFEPSYTNWSILEDQYFWSGDQNFTQVWRFRVEKWDPLDPKRTISINIFSEKGASYSIRLKDEDEFVTASAGQHITSRGRTLEFSGSTVSRLYGSFIEEGFVSDRTIEVSGTTSNDGTYTVSSVTATTITVEETFTTESSPSAVITGETQSLIGDSSDWESTLETASAQSPVYLEFVVQYNAQSSSLTSEVYLGDTSLSQAESFTVSPGRKKIVLDIFNQLGEVEIYLEYIIAKDGALADTSTDLDFSTVVGTEFSFGYEIDEPIIDSMQISWEPWELSPTAEVVTQIQNEITVDINEDYAGYAPTYARIEDGDDWMLCQQLSKSNNRVTYQIDERSESGLTFDGVVKVRPWYLKKSEHSWEDAGILRTKYLIPFDGEMLWIRKSKAVELDMYGRYARLLGLPREDDSQEYLNAIRGFQYASLSQDTAELKRRAIGAILNQPYALSSGVISEPVRVYDTDGSILHDRVVVGRRVYQIDPFWDNNDLLKKPGQRVEFMEPLVREVKIYDWKNNVEEVLRSVDSPWEQWGTFVVRIPSFAGITPRLSDYIIRMLDKTKSKDNVYILEYESSEEINPGEENIEWLNGEPNDNMVFYGHSVEDLIFDDVGTVYQNDMNYQLVRADDAPSYANYVIENFDDTQHLWPLQEGGDNPSVFELVLGFPNFEDVVGNANGTHTSSVTIGDSSDVRFDRAVDYSASATELSTIDNGDISTDFDSDFTLFAWVKGAGAAEQLIQKYDGTDGFVLRTVANALGVFVSSGGITTSASIPTSDLTDGNWHMIAAVFDATADRMDIYDYSLGSFLTGAVLTTTLGSFITTDDLLLGDGILGSGLSGQMAEVGIIQKALDTDELLTLFYGGAYLTSEEYQSASSITLDAGYNLDQWEHLQYSLQINDVYRDEDGYVLKNESVFLKRYPSDAEISNSIVQSPLRMSGSNNTFEYHKRGQERCWVFDGASPDQSVVDGGGTLLTYTTASWDDVSVATAEDFNDIYLDETLAVAVGTNGEIWESTDYGASWTDKSIGGTDDFEAVHGVWAVGENTIAYERVAGTWTSRTVDAGTWILNDVFFIDSNTGWIVATDGAGTPSSVLFKTTDGGSNWNNIHTFDPDVPASGVNVTGVCFYDSNNGWTISSDGVRRTTDGGTTWEGVALSAETLTGLTLPAYGHAYFSTADGIHYSTNARDAFGSITFTQVYAGTSFTDVDFYDKLTGLTHESTELFTLYSNVDGGLSGSGTTQNINAVSIRSPYAKMAAGPGGEIWRWV